ncbi:MAG: hypothetical protein ABIR71_08240 [Chthoniobacterales bacterium]
MTKFERDRDALGPWQYHQTLTTQQLDADGKVVAKGTWKSIVRPGDPKPPEYTFKSMEGKLSFFASGSEEEGTGKPPAKSKPKTESELETNRAESAVAAVRKYKLRERYQWKRLPDASMGGESAYVLSFAPKPNQKARTREERFFSLLAGKMWVSQSDYSTVKAEVALQTPCPLFWLIARVTTFRFTYELEPNPGNRLLRLSKASARTVVTFPFYSVRQKHWQTVDKYEPRGPRGK